jgi:beta-N-acetylhexosaminidase
MTSKALILGCQGPVLTADERLLFSQAKPWGLILFRRNLIDSDQINLLTAEFRRLVGRADAPVLIDQEGGRVQRMGPPHWRKYPAAAQFLEASKGNVSAAAELARVGAQLIAYDLRNCGITIDCMPVLDCRFPDTTDAIGDRAYASDPAAIAEIALAAARGLLDGGVLPVIKHMPGHGRAKVDSHHLLPKVRETREELEKSDFSPFKMLNTMPLGMTGHIVFEAIDPMRPATLSSTVIREVIRGWIGFDGLLLSDDLSMKALSGDFTERTRALFQAGCDVALHCNGISEEAVAVAEASPVLSGNSLERAQRALAYLEKPVLAFDPVEAAKFLEAKLALTD